ncbi:MAG: SRPBCC domain-containing protein [Gammaproteobacteria bacterium]
MPGCIRQSTTLPTSARQLYDMYLSPRAHAAFTGAPVTIGRKPGARFSAFGGQIFGSILATVPGRLIVQRWRSTNFAAGDPDSTLILSFTPVSTKSARIDLVQIDVSDADLAGVRKGWPKYYWRPWRMALLAGKRV